MSDQGTTTTDRGDSAEHLAGSSKPAPTTNEARPAPPPGSGGKPGN